MTIQAAFHFYGRVATLLESADKKMLITYHFHGSPAIKDSIEALGLPHTEVDLILVAGCSVGFGYRLARLSGQSRQGQQAVSRSVGALSAKRKNQAPLPLSPLQWHASTC